jgi:RHS repeat-associated protein
MVTLSDGMATVGTYAYDGLNRRIVKGLYASGSLDHNEHAYYNENWQSLEIRKEVSGAINSNPLEQYVWNPLYIDAPLLRDYDASTSGTQTRSYYIFDPTYNVTSVVTNAGTVVERYHYSPYGTLTILDPDFSNDADGQSDILNAVMYAGRYLDVETGLYQYRNRYYHVQLGRFTTRDPIAYEPNGLNLYEYASSMPLTRLDPFGLDPNLPGKPLSDFFKLGIRPDCETDEQLKDWMQKAKTIKAKYLRMRSEALARKDGARVLQLDKAIYEVERRMNMMFREQLWRRTDELGRGAWRCFRNICRGPLILMPYVEPYYDIEGRPVS